MNLYQRAKAGHEPREDDSWFLPTTKTSHVHLEEDEVVVYQHNNVNRSCYVHTVHTNETVQGNSIVYEGIVEYGCADVPRSNVKTDNIRHRK